MLKLLKLINARSTFQIWFTNHSKSCSSTHVIPKSRQHQLQVHIYTKPAEVNIQLHLQSTQKLHINRPLKRTRNPLLAPFRASLSKTLRQAKQDKSLLKSVSQQQMSMSLCYTLRKHHTLVIRPCYQSPSMELQLEQWGPKRRVWQTPSTNQSHPKAIPVKEHL